MLSIIEGYNYDIFISYRQKDNKGDRWVSEFVEALKTELGSTFKEEISVYFDINPHDGLLETHDVDESLKNKLKCLIFIPIISRTYCDAKSFAWEYEFKAFIELATKDRLGLKVNLPNGNVANRLIPVQIHDLYPEDKAFIEKELGGILRSIEFIYKEPGVNRPLTASDNDEKNSNKTKYRNQINKVANAIDEVIHSLKGLQSTPLGKKAPNSQLLIDEVEEEKSKEAAGGALNSSKLKKWQIIMLSVALCSIGSFAVYNIFGNSKKANAIAKLEKSIAVLPFVNDSPDQENTYFINGIMDEILNNLQKIKDFRVLSRTSTEQYRGTNKPTIPKIAKELDVNYIVEGSGQKYGNKFVLRVQLITANNEKHLWGESFEQEIRETSDIINLQSQIAQKIAAELKTTITPEEKQLIEKFPTQNVKAYDDYLKGYDYYNKGTEGDLLRAIQYYKNAIAYDPNFALAYTGISWAYMRLLFNANWLPEEVYPKARDAALKALEIDNNLSEAHTVISSIILHNDWDINKAEKELNIAILLNPNSPSAYDVYATLLNISCRTKEALEKYKHVLALNPNSEDVKFFYGLYLYYAVKTDSAIFILKKGVENDPNSDRKHYFLGFVYLERGEYLKSILELEQAIKLNPYPQPYYLYLGIAYNRIGKPDETKKILDKLNTLGEKNNKVAFGKAVLLAELGETDQSIYWLRKAYEERHQFLLYLKSVPVMCSSIRTDPRFIEIYKKIWPDD